MAEANLKELTADIAASYVGANKLPQSDISTLINTIYGALAETVNGSTAVIEDATPKATPAQIRKSIQPDYLVSFVDGKRYKTIRRHLTTQGYTIDRYREEFGLPTDYPTVSPNYSKARSEMAKALGLGRGGPNGKVPKRGRKPKAAAQ